MALALPFLAYLLLVPLVRRWQTRSSIDVGGWSVSLLLAAAFWGAGVALLSEALSLGDALRPVPILVAWLAADVLLLILVARRGRAAWAEARSLWSSILRPGEWPFAILLALNLFILLLVAWVAPPNNADSLLYHMPRVLHWIQNGNLQPYATGYGHQLWNPPWSELAILHLRTLWGNDTPAELVQWASLIGLLAAVWGSGKLLGLSRPARLVAVGFAAGLPMVQLQATSTQNDLVTAWWIAAVGCLVLLHLKATPGRVESLGLGAAIGLALLTKGTAYVFAAPLGVWFLLSRPWRTAPGFAAKQIALITAAVILLNLGYWSRNLAVAGTPLGPSEFVASHGFGALKPKIALYLPRVVRGVALHFATPWPSVNDALDAGIKQLYARFGVEVNARLIVWAWNHEDRAGNPLHFLLLVASAIWLASRRRWERVDLGGLGLGALAGLALLFLGVSSSLTSEGIRLQLPFFTLWAPILGAAFEGGIPRRWLTWVALTLLAAGLPWLLFNASRPVIGLRPNPGPWELPCSDAFGCTQVGSVWTERPQDLLFANVPFIRADLPAVTAALDLSSCRTVGLRLDSHDPEYLLWAFLGAPQSGVHLETIYTTPELAPLIDRTHPPCAVICTVCGGRTRLHGLPLTAASGAYTLFEGGDFTWDEDG